MGSMGDMPRFQFYPAGSPEAGAHGLSKPIGPMSHASATPGKAPPTEPMNQAPAEVGQAKPPVNKPHSSTSKRPPAKKTSKKSQKFCCGVLPGFTRNPTRLFVIGAPKNNIKQKRRAFL